MKIYISFFLFIFSFLNYLHADEIKFLDKELARESVLPIFDHPEAVKSRTVETKNHLDIQLGGGAALNDPFFDVLIYQGALTYHFTEIHGLGVQGTVFSRKSSQFVPQLSDKGIKNLEYIPSIEKIVFLNYEITPFYGKISLTKDGVLNLSTYFTLGLADLFFNDTTKLALGVGVGEKLFFGKRFGIVADLKSIIYKGPDPLSYNLKDSTEPESLSKFELQNKTMFIATLGLVFIF